MNDALRQQILANFPAVERIHFRIRGTKRYLTVEYYGAGSHDTLARIRQDIARRGYPRCYITSGGLLGGTIRLNPEK